MRDPQSGDPRPAVTSLRKDLAVRSESWRYIRYWDGSEELYDHVRDPLEWYNLAGRPESAAVKAELAAWLPSAPRDVSLEGEQIED